MAEDALDLARRQWAEVRPELDTRSMASIGRLLRIARHLTLFSDEVLAPFGITRGEFELMATLRRCGAQSPTDLALALIASKATITKRMKQLERQQLITRAPSAKDRRAVVVTLSDSGSRLLDEVLPVQLALERAVLAAIPEDRWTELEGLMNKLLTDLEAHEHQTSSVG